MAGSWYVRAGRSDALRYSRRIEASSAVVRIDPSAIRLTSAWSGPCRPVARSCRMGILLPPVFRLVRPLMHQTEHVGSGSGWDEVLADRKKPGVDGSTP